MVRKTNYRNRFAFTMIELIFAIVIIAISVLSLPVMSQINSRGMENSIVQEAIFAASTELMGASAGYWDFNSMEDSNLSDMSRVIDVSISGVQTCVDDNTSDRHRLRPGHIAQPFHRMCVNSTSGDINNTTNSDFPNLNNAAHSTNDIFISTATDATGYKETYKSSLSVTTDATDTNIKLLEVRVTDQDDNLLVVLKMQSANIGEIDYYKRNL